MSSVLIAGPNFSIVRTNSDWYGCSGRSNTEDRLRYSYCSLSTTTTLIIVTNLHFLSRRTRFVGMFRGSLLKVHFRNFDPTTLHFVV
jgi:hypothetical protein